VMTPEAVIVVVPGAAVLDRVVVMTVPEAVIVVTTGASVLAAGQLFGKRYKDWLASRDSDSWTSRIVLHDVTILDSNRCCR